MIKDVSQMSDIQYVSQPSNFKCLNVHVYVFVPILANSHYLYWQSHYRNWFPVPIVANLNSGVWPSPFLAWAAVQSLMGLVLGAKNVGYSTHSACPLPPRIED